MAYVDKKRAKRGVSSMAEWERILLNATKPKPSLGRKLREARRLRISEAARRNGMTYNQFMSGARQYDPSLAGAGQIGDMTPADLDELAAAIKGTARS